MVTLISQRVETISHATSYGAWDSRGARVSHDIRATVTRDGSDFVGTVAVDGALQPAIRFGTYQANGGAVDVYPAADYDAGAEVFDPARWTLEYMIRRGIDAADSLAR